LILFDLFTIDALTDIKLTGDKRCISLSCMDGKVRLMDRVTGELLNAYTGHMNQNYKIEHCLSYNEKHVISGSEDSHIYFWDMVEGKVVHKLPVPSAVSTIATNVVNCVSYHAEEDTMISASFDGTIRLWGKQ